MLKDGKAHAPQESRGEGMRKIMQEMIFRSRPDQTLYTALIDAMHIYGRGRKMVEDMRQTEFSYNAPLKMTLVIGLWCVASAGGRHGRDFMPNLAATLCMVIGTTAFRRVPAMLNYTAGTDGIQSACVAAKISTIVTSRKFLKRRGFRHRWTHCATSGSFISRDLQPTVNLGGQALGRSPPDLSPAARQGCGSRVAGGGAFTSGSEG